MIISILIVSLIGISISLVAGLELNQMYLLMAILLGLLGWFDRWRLSNTINLYHNWNEFQKELQKRL